MSEAGGALFLMTNRSLTPNDLGQGTLSRMENLGWSDSSAVRSTSCSPRGRRFDAQDDMAAFNHGVTPVPEDVTTNQTSWDTELVPGTQTCAEVKITVDEIII